MSQDRVGKPWTKEEDELLIQAVAVHGEVDNWKTVALSISGRTNKACRKRWLHSLSPSVKKTAWTPEEDKLLLSLYALHGTKWSVIARGIPGRTDDACSKRYREALDPTLKKDEWTSEEDDRLLQVYARLGGKWGQVGHELNRSGLACRNRWRLLQRRKAANNSQTSQQTLNSTVGPSTQHPAPLDHVNPSAWISSLPGIDPAQLWSGGRSAGYYEPLDYHTQEHNYASTSFGPSLGPVSIPNGMHSGSSSPPPFQFSSSSLSAALSISRPTNNVPSSSHHISESQNPSTSPGSHRPSSIDGEPLQPTPSYSPEPQQHDLEFEAHPQGGGDNDHYEDNDMPIFDDFEQQHDMEPTCPEPLTPPESRPSGPRVEEDYESEPPPQNVDSLASQGQEQGPVSIPTSSSTFAQQQPSLVSSSTSAETDRAQDTSSSSRHYRSEADKTRTGIQQRKPKEQSGPPPRLSSTLSVNPDLLAYACGHEDCWPSSTAKGSNCFATSRELSDHWKVEHASAIVNAQPFRCALTGCGRGWKSLNGLQYHLQVSKVHFQQALSATAAASAQNDTSTHAEDGPSPNKHKKVKLFKCDRPNCMHQYRQKSGLRYHLTHGHLDHSDTVPAQLDVVPPTLARKIAQAGQNAAAEDT